MQQFQTDNLPRRIKKGVWRKYKKDYKAQYNGNYKDFLFEYHCGTVFIQYEAFDYFFSMVPGVDVQLSKKRNDFVEFILHFSGTLPKDILSYVYKGNLYIFNFG